MDLYDDVNFVFHGGEPLLLGIDYFSKILSFQQLRSSSIHSIRNIIQTNGTLINDDWCRFFRENRIHVGVSLDGPKEVQDAHRLFINGQSTFMEITHGISKLVANDVHKFGILSVATKELLEYDSALLFDFFTRNLGIGLLKPPDYFEISFLAERPPTASFRSISEARGFYLQRIEYAKFLCNIYRNWKIRDDPTIRIRELSSKMDSLVGGHTYVCTEDGPCVGKYFGIDESGNLAHCDTFFENSRFVFGNLKKNSLSDILKSEKYLKAIEYEKRIRSKCNPCKWFPHCKGGCLYEALLFNESGLGNRMTYCHSKIIFDFMSDDLSQYVNM